MKIALIPSNPDDKDALISFTPYLPFSEENKPDTIPLREIAQKP
jgi:hypothetical protein